MTAVSGLSLGLRPRLPVILQTEAAECGLACLAMIANHHGYHIDLPSLRRRFPMSLKGTTLTSLINIADQLGMMARPLRLELEDLGRLRRPALLHWRFNHFVVLQAVGVRTITVHDPANGLRKVSLGEASDAFTGVALELWPSQRFRAREEKQVVRIRALIGGVTGLYHSLAQILLLALALEVFALVSPLFLQWVIDHVLVSGDLDLLATLALGFALLVILQQAVTTLRSWVIMHFGADLNVQWHTNVFAHMLRLPLQYFERRHLGDLVSRFRSIDAIQRTLTTAFIESIVDGMMTVAVLVVIFVYSAALSWVCLCAMALYALSRWLWYRPLRVATEEQIAHAAKQESHFLETVRGVRAIKLFQRQDERRIGWMTLLVDQTNAGLRSQRLHILYRFLNGTLFGVENVLVIWLGATAVLDGRFSVGMLTAFMAYKAQFSSRVSALIDKAFEVKMLQLQGERLADIVMTKPDPEGASRLAASETESAAPTIELRRLRFKYAEHEPYVLDGVDLRVEAGESLAITGPSGCGKTTLLHVMLGILAPTDGEVLVGGRNTTAAGGQVMRDMIACVTQNDTLFAGSIADNISFFDSHADQQRVEECARRASIHADIVALPMAYNTFVGYMGSALSGGQQQRVLLARALYKQPKILILDEATSHLDIGQEAVVSSAIRDLNITRITVAHRPQTVESADRIVTLDHGRIASTARPEQRPPALVRAPDEADFDVSMLSLDNVLELDRAALDILLSTGC